MGFKAAGKMFLANTLECSGLGSWTRSSPRPGVLVLNYHRIGAHDGSPFDWGLWSATQDEFDAQVRFLKSEFDLIAPSELDDVFRARQRRCVLITFDDGYQDNYSLAYPVLKNHNVSATFFLSTGFLDHPHISWWDDVSWMVKNSTREKLPSSHWIQGETEIDRDEPQKTIRTLLQVYKSLPGDETPRYLDFLAAATGSGRCPQEQATGIWMTWDMVREMHQGGMSFGGHTVNHPILARLNPAAKEYEICESCARIQHELGTPVKYFSYPVGGPTAFDRWTHAALQKAGIQWAFTYGYGTQASRSDFPYTIPRIPVESDFNMLHFRAMTTWPSLFC
ncbi:MAG: polysaccharide deacetylase family protein [Planctomycetales bacterium]